MSTIKPDPMAKTPTATGAESPTTVRPLDMEDDDVQETGVVAGEPHPTTTAQRAVEEHAPAKPPRPLSAQQQAENTLKEAFPNIDAAVVKAVLIASGGRIEPAFNALLGMSDPDAVVEPIVEPPPPVQPPRPTATRMGSTPQSQLEADEMYARQLAQHYDATSYNEPRSNRAPAPQKNSQRGQNLKPNELHDENYSFIDDDLPVIKENLRKGFIDTQKTFNGWISNLRKRIDGDDIEEEGAGAAPSQNERPQNAQYGQRRSGDARRSGDYNRYDADPQVLGDDFAGIQLNDDGERRQSRPATKPDLFKPTPNAPKSDGRRVAFQSNQSEEDLYRTSPKVGAKDAPKQSKWQPLSSVEPNPVENDPFSLGDSEDERETKERVEAKKTVEGTSEALKKGETASTLTGKP